MELVENDEKDHPWSGEETYKGPQFTRYNSYQKFVADRVCECLAKGWLFTKNDK